jgi:molecular chaperone DnaK
MVMDQWQASLMRALAQLQLRESPSTRARVQEKFELDEASAGAAAEEAGASSQAQEEEGRQQASSSLRDVQPGAGLDPKQQQQLRQATQRGKLSSKRVKNKRPQAG